MTSLRGIFVSESTFYEFIPCDLLKMLLFFKVYTLDKIAGDMT